VILVTGGAGFLGSNLQAALFDRGYETAILDTLGSEGKWRNIARHPPARLVHPDELEDWLAPRPPLEMVFHMAAESRTTATDGDHVWRTNVELSLRLWEYCAQRQVRFVYAGSGSTYGDGSDGFDDDPAALDRLQPLNLYGWSKHVFDLRVMDMLRRGAPRPPQWAGLKFFNVFGPNEYHKGPMISVVKLKYDEVSAGRPATLFRSTVAGVADGAQARDFIYVDDAVAIMLWLLDSPAVSGLFNVGTGVSRSFLDVVQAVCDAAGVARQVAFVDVPEALAPHYQSFTQARIDRLRAAGYAAPFLSLEDGVAHYVRDYLAGPNPYR
jgi:ADP-L-glycero-D-manno-heptose 6-epimerase